MKDNLYFCLGFIQGDGGLGRLKSDTHKGMEVNIGYKDDDVLPYFEINKIPDTRAYYINGFNDICRDLDFSSESLPNRALPETYAFWKVEDQIDFLKGLYSANGSFIKVGRVAFKTTCKELSRQLKGVLEHFGFNPYITTNKNKDVKFSNGTYTCKESYDINLGRQSEILKFYHEIGFAQSYKMENIEFFLIKKKLLERD